ncbi:purine-nucleoside phosphorylase [Devosia psychrophila]|jgi:purine-nucleoside phosphorylase|uniref:Purine nucleoside phosphorylase DeoD-type n=1 Tax=Devosia psychrophila TaxID=728005 RepID=A0A0F5PXW5_9HYPH|nr:purine-nucleoside phosphorylase [Devosia psychrophila]KKC33460.1 purine nucleoside phosphorylase [Devosia psychrophila]SFB92532.1 purine-nucleoside phosphorylase [Devosia psychrophila]
MTPHNHAKAGDYAEAVLLPGDPLRAKWIAETFFDDAKLVNSVRNCLGYTGTWKGKSVSVQASGMGQPSLAIYVHELINVYGVKTLIRVGTCGGLNAKVKVRDLILAQGASTDSSIVKGRFGAFNFAPIADFELLRSAASKAEEKGMRYHAGNMLSSDIFYHADGMAGYDKLPEHGVLGVEMEAAALYTLAARFGVKALTICTMTDCLITKEEIDAEQRQTSLRDMVEVALDVAVEG